MLSSEGNQDVEKDIVENINFVNKKNHIPHDSILKANLSNETLCFSIANQIKNQYGINYFMLRTTRRKLLKLLKDFIKKNEENEEKIIKALKNELLIYKENNLSDNANIQIDLVSIPLEDYLDNKSVGIDLALIWAEQANVTLRVWRPREENVPNDICLDEKMSCIVESPVESIDLLYISDTRFFIQLNSYMGIVHTGKKILSRGVPFFLSNVVTISNSFITAVFLSRLDSKNLAAASVAFLVKGLVSGAEGALLFPTQPLIGQYYGNKQYDEVGAVLQQSWLIGTITAVPTIIVLLRINPILINLGYDAELVSLASSYIYASLPTLLLERWNESDVLFLVAVENGGAMFWLKLLAKITSLSVSYSLLTGSFGLPKLGLLGAGLASLSEALVGFLALKTYLLFKHDIKKFNLLKLRTCKSLYESLRIIRMGLPMVVLNVVFFPVSILNNIMISRLGNSKLALDQIIFQCTEIFSTVTNAITQSTAIDVAHAAGAKNFPAMRRSANVGLVINGLCSIITPVSFIIFSDYFYNLFNPNSAENRLASSVIKSAFIIMGIKQVFATMGSNSAQNLMSIFDITRPSIVNLFLSFTVSLPLSYMLSNMINLDLNGVYIGGLTGAIYLSLAWGGRWYFLSSNETYLNMQSSNEAKDEDEQNGKIDQENELTNTNILIENVEYTEETRLLQDTNLRQESPEENISDLPYEYSDINNLSDSSSISWLLSRFGFRSANRGHQDQEESVISSYCTIS